MFEIKLFICLKIDLTLNNGWYAIKPKQTKQNFYKNSLALKESTPCKNLYHIDKPYETCTNLIAKADRDWDETASHHTHTPNPKKKNSSRESWTMRSIINSLN